MKFVVVVTACVDVDSYSNHNMKMVHFTDESSNAWKYEKRGESQMRLLKRIDVDNNCFCCF